MKKLLQDLKKHLKKKQIKIRKIYMAAHTSMKNLAYLQIIHTNGNERQRSVAEILKILGSTTN